VRSVAKAGKEKNKERIDNVRVVFIRLFI